MHLSTPYQITKMLGELYANYFHDQLGLPVVKARLFNSFGPWDPPGRYRNVIPNFFWRALQGLPLPITGDGSETRDFTYVGDIVDGLLRAGVYPEAIGQEFNLGGGKETRILDLAARINALTGNEAGVEFLPRRAWDTKSRLLASVARAEELLGYRPRTSLDEGLRAVLRWFEEHWELLREDPRFRPAGLP